MTRQCSAQQLEKLSNWSVEVILHRKVKDLKKQRTDKRRRRYEELGSGVRRVNQYLPHYAPGAGEPIFDDGDMFTVTVPISAEFRSTTAAVNDEVAEKLKAERSKIAAEESKKAKLALATDLDRKERELAELQDILIYVTTQTLNRHQLTVLSDEVGAKRTLLVCCSAFRVKPDASPNLTLKKIPKAVLRNCEWDRDDYSLEISVLPAAPTEEERQAVSISDLPLFQKDVKE